MMKSKESIGLTSPDGGAWGIVEPETKGKTMPEISTMGNSRYLKKEEFLQPTVFTVSEVVEENVAMENEPAKMRWVAKFQESEKGLVLNKTNLDNGGFVSGITNTDNWGGQKFTLFNDQSVMYNGKRGGIRIQIPQQSSPQSQAPNEPPEGDIPF